MPSSRKITLEDAAVVLSQLLHIQFWQANRQPDDLALIASCTQLLEAKPALHSLLKLAHGQNETNYASITDSPLFPAFVSAAAQAALRDTGEKLENALARESHLPSWEPRISASSPIYSDTDVRKHLASLGLRKTSEFTTDMSIILHDLGGFEHDPPLRARVTRLFTPRNKFLVNASGTGKTRLCYEGLCTNWGLYFTLHVDSGWLGSHDIQSKLEGLLEYHRNRHSIEDSQPPEQTTLLASRWFGVLLLCRLLILQQFLEIVSSDAGGIHTEHKLRWLELQLAPPQFKAGAQDVFTRVGNALEEHSNDMANLQSDIDDALRKIRHVIGHDSPMFIVIDEAQVGLDPKSWQLLTRGACTFICAGIKIPPSIVAGGIGDGFEWTSDTGEFDDPDAHERYIEKFLPPALRDSSSGHLLGSRLWRWCRGRHRFTDKFLSILLTNGLQFPHTTLSQFIEAGTGLRPLDAVQVCHEEAHPQPRHWSFSFGTPTFQTLPPDDKNHVLSVLYRLMGTHQTNKFDVQRIDLVYKGHGRFIDANMSQIAFDEPSILVLAARQLFPAPVQPIEGRPNNRPSTFISSLQLNPPKTRQDIAHCLAFYLSQVLGRQQLLTEILDFPHSTPVWARQTAQLVRFHLNDSGESEHSMVDSDIFRSLLPLATETSSLEETTEWIEHKYGTTFCISSSPNLDLLCAVRLEDGSFIWLAIKTLAADEHVTDEILKPMVSLLDIDNVFLEEDVVDSTSVRQAINALRSLPGVKKQRPVFLRAFTAFPNEIDLSNCVDKRRRDCANVSFRALRRSKHQVMQEDFFDAIINGAIAGTKRKSQWDNGSLHENRKRSKMLEMDLIYASKRDYVLSREPDPQVWWDMAGEELSEESESSFDFDSDPDTDTDTDSDSPSTSPRLGASKSPPSPPNPKSQQKRKLAAISEAESASATRKRKRYYH
ncbi:hypothetical protein MIND_00876000 [Mycena indigotica]|uniref:Uncharacterized protein n=1 Tax=Mycena indigotica TaxID=2126181 RepID=A0A8H6SHX9_9AGAR|nr:uncharacterized protein MIND_00876000 [Mycena indigotica]KAF7299273.1 hypothetical protein MIND_00876000 [Mycena indigotica]